MMDHMMGGPGGMGVMLLMGLSWLLVLAAVVAGVVWAIRALSDRGPGRRSGGSGQEAPLDILRRRYAAGELSREEFERMRRELAGS